MIFAKSYRGELMLSTIWYAPHACFYATLSPASSDEQTLVDTAFPQVRARERCCPPALHRRKNSPASVHPARTPRFTGNGAA